MIILLILTAYLLYNYRIGYIVSKEIFKKSGSSITHYIIYVKIGTRIYEKEVSKLDFYFSYFGGYTLIKINYHNGLIYL